MFCLSGIIVNEDLLKSDPIYLLSNLGSFLIISVDHKLQDLSLDIKNHLIFLTDCGRNLAIDEGEKGQKHNSSFDCSLCLHISTCCNELR